MKNVLVVVDMQNDFIDGALGTAEAVKIVPAVRKKIENFDGIVLFTRDTHESSYLETQEGRKLPVSHCIKGTEGWMIRKELEELRKTEAIDKETFGSVGLGRKLCELNEEFGIGAITFVGLCTDICVISNALLAKAFLPEVPISVDQSCCAGVTPESHENALKAMAACQIEIIGGKQMSDFEFKNLSQKSTDIDLVRTIYNENFPEKERVYSFDELLQLVQQEEHFKIGVLYEDGNAVALFCYFDFDEFFYLVYFAVSSERQGGGLGSKLIRFFMEAFPEKAIIGAIETPIPGTSNYEQRIKRKAFWERQNILMSKYSYGSDAENMLTLTSSRQDETGIGYYASFFEYLMQRGKIDISSITTYFCPGTRFYRTENGKMIEVPLSEWLAK